MEALRASGNTVVVAIRRSMGLYLRVQGYATAALGDGAELKVFDDPSIFTNRFNGWSSWRRTITHYSLPWMASDVAGVEEAIDRWAPDLAVVTGFAAPARIAAARRRLPVLDVSIYPQHRRLAGSGARRFVPAFRRAVEALLTDSGAPIDAARALWGEPADVLLHDRALLGSTAPDLAPVGFPYWDNVPGRPEDDRALDAVAHWDAGSTVLVTLGSFIGVAQQAMWGEAADAVAMLGLQGIFVGARGRWSAGHLADRTDILCVGFVPLSRHLAKVSAVVHHGGIRTTFGVLRAGLPAVVTPHAFDQSYNGRLVAAAGVGCISGLGRLAHDIEAAMRGAETRRARELASNLERVRAAGDRPDGPGARRDRRRAVAVPLRRRLDLRSCGRGGRHPPVRRDGALRHDRCAADERPRQRGSRARLHRLRGSPGVAPAARSRR